jgi:hypothetical protein|tara:strand:- start:5283 stop:5654 length:372 start_codon:yes stop_codon:yes gene_type:complete
VAINAIQVTNTETLEQLRGQFNNLVTDVSALENGTLNFGAVSATTINVSDLIVSGTLDFTAVTATSLKIDGSSIVFEGSTVSANETTFTVTDPTADRTITFPDATGTVLMTGSTIDLGDDSGI